MLLTTTTKPPCQGNVAEAISMLQRSLTIYEKALGVDHQVVANTRGNMAMAKMASKDAATVAAGEAGVRSVLHALCDIHHLPDSHPWIVKFRAALE